MLGTKDFALPTFEHLAETGHDLVALITQPDRPQGRKQLLIPSRIKESATARGIRVEQPEDVNAPEALAVVRSLAGRPHDLPGLLRAARDSAAAFGSLRRARAELGPGLAFTA